MLRILRLKTWIFCHHFIIFQIFTDASFFFSSPLALTFEVSTETSSASRSDSTTTASEVAVRRIAVDTATHHFASNASSTETSGKTISVIRRHEVRRRNSKQTWRCFWHLIHVVIAMWWIVSNLVVDPRFSLLIHFVLWHYWWRRSVHVDLMRQREHVWHWKIAVIWRQS